MNALPAWMYVYHMHAWCPQRPEEGIRFPGTGVTGSSKSPDTGAGDLNSGPPCVL